MSLFGDLPSAKHDVATVSGPEFKPFRKHAMLAPPPSILRSKKRAREGPASHMGDTLAQAPVFAAHSIFSAFGPIEDEYDPARPNDYEKAKDEREKRAIQAEKEVIRQTEQRQSEAAGARNGQADEGSGTGGLGHSSQPSSGPKMTVAMKMMKQMGWNEGEGLGKDLQGMATPIVLHKTDKRTGIIVNAEPIHKPKTGVTPPGTPSKVFLLRNMVAPHEVDEHLEDEIAEEVSNFGSVQRVLIFLVTEKDFDPSQAVRIFVEMDSTDAATRAIISLQGRFFGGKEVRATYYSEEKFALRDLAPSADELRR